MIKKKSKNGICVINFPISKKGEKPVYQLLEILKKTNKNISLIGGFKSKNFHKKYLKKVTFFKITHNIQNSLIARILSYLKIQIMISLAVKKSKKDNNIYIFFIGGEGLLIPHILTKLYRKKTILLIAGFPSKELAFKRDPLFFIEKILSKINFLISNKILVYSPNIILERKLKFYRNKIDIFCQSYISESEMNFNKISEKNETVGFLGGISIIKGVHNLFIAFKRLQYKNNITLHIGGIGNNIFVKKLLKYAEKNGFRERVIFHGWINRKHVPKFFSKIKYFVLPSISEGIPNVILEAMACGCCVISTPVGGIPDVIKDNFNGFIIKNNSPNSIYEGILRAKSSNLNQISINAYKTIKEQYLFGNVVKKLKSILKNM